MPNPHISTQDWYYHAPSKRAAQSPKAVPPASQIPGIGGIPDESAIPEGDDRHFRRKWIRDTDSKYIKLAKGGGRKNLLAFRSPPLKTEEPLPYPRVDWFDHEHPVEDELEESGYAGQCQEQHTEQKERYHVLPEWYVHVHDIPDEDQYVTASYRTKRPIMGHDNLSKWQRDAKDTRERKPNNVRLPPLKKTHKPDKRYEELMEVQKSDHQPQRRQVRLPKIDSQPVDLKHLLSMGYQRDWLDEQGQKVKDERAERKKQQKDIEEKREIQNRNAIRKPKDLNASDSDNPIFKLSKFDKVHPRVESFRT